MVSKPRYQDPAEVQNKVRHHVFALFEITKDIDKALRVIPREVKDPTLLRRIYAGIKGELIFYTSDYHDKMKLEPLLDAGTKADFSGVSNGKAVNIDVTTNLAYKDINTYASLTEERAKLYELALVNIRTGAIDLFPLRFPVCWNCGKFSHYVLVIDEPRGGFLWASESQVLYQKCLECGSSDQVGSFNFLINSPIYSLTETYSDIDDPQQAESINANQYLFVKTVPIAKLFERITGKMLSAVAELTYEIDDPRDASGDFVSKVLWAHQLCPIDLGQDLDAY